MLRYLPPLLIALLACCTLGVWETLAYGFVVAPFAFFWSACPCCDGNCTIFTDDFSTDRTGTDYTVVSGSWSVGSGVLSTSSASALILSDTAVTSSGVHITATLTLGTTSDKGRIYFNYVDANNYWYAEFQPGAFFGTVKLFEVSAGGSPTQQGGAGNCLFFGAASAVSICVAFTGNRFLATVEAFGFKGTAISDVIFAGTVAGTYAGLGTGAGTSSATFDDFQIKKNRSDDSACSSCGYGAACAECQADEIPVALQIDIDSLADDASGCAPENQCDAKNDSFIVDLQSCAFWSGSIGADVMCCAGATGQPNQVAASLTHTSTYVLRVGLANSGTSEGIYWEVDFGANPPNCVSWSDLSLTLVSNDCGDCDASSSTCKVTAIF